jgi:hypothetical protein
VGVCVCVCACVCVCVCVWKVWATSGRVEGERWRPKCGVVVDGQKRNLLGLL